MRFDVEEKIVVTDHSDDKGQQPHHRVVRAPALEINIVKHL
jgi:hypothetical protein